MPFQKGVSGNAKGRPKQTPDQKKEKEQFISLLREATLPALQGVIEIASDKQSRDRLRACQYLLDKAYGQETSFLSDDKPEPIVINIVRHNPNREETQDADESWD